MKAMVLAAGFGSRMVPITLHQAKPTLPFLHRALLLRQLDALRTAAVDEVVINVHHQPNSVLKLLAGAAAAPASGDLQPAAERPFQVEGQRVHVSMEAERQGTSGGLRGAASLLRGGGTIVCLNADMICGLDLEQALAVHRRHGRHATLVLVPWQAGCGYTPVRHDGTRLLGFGPDAGGGRQGAAPGIFTGIHLLEESILDRLPPGRSEFLPDLYLPMLAAGEAPAVFMTDAPWYELGTPQRYLDGQRQALHRPPPLGHQAWGGPIASDCALGSGVQLLEDTILGPGVDLGGGCRLSACAIMDGAVIGAGSELTQVIVGPGVEIPAGTRLQRAVLSVAGDLPDTVPAEPVKRWQGVLRADF